MVASSPGTTDFPHHTVLACHTWGSAFLNSAPYLATTRSLPHLVFCCFLSLSIPSAYAANTRGLVGGVLMLADRKGYPVSRAVIDTDNRQNVSLRGRYWASHTLNNRRLVACKCLITSGPAGLGHLAVDLGYPPAGFPPRSAKSSIYPPTRCRGT